ncbi:Coiled-coil domain-containing protein 3-like protein [Dinothrombium tinctorium]|uniref:Coiled-coil domain-containing protein 3-like protein n=1 Tax=Dinothrombium tinctorium TaxID=1965070 RepID=A0A3S3PD33_9ACAR|nr:Coiled-coil domain-containing protein 3-like protein [Dinothrombium tinctorium]
MAASKTLDVSVPHGKVTEVCKEWSVKEDGVLAYKLQNEEIEQHYEGNRLKSKLGRIDFHKAKHLQEDEQRKLDEERQRMQQQLEDEHLAQEIQSQLLLEERRREAALREEDERIAKKLQQKEKERLLKRRLEREKMQVEKIKLEKGFNVDDPLENGHDLACNHSETNRDYLSEIDLSEFCMKPPPGLSEEEMKQFLAEQDAEIALFLQQQEAKVKDATLKEKQMLVEAQDYEIARILQKEEKAKAKRLREKARQKSLQKQLQNEIGTSVDDEYNVNGFSFSSNAAPESNKKSDEETNGVIRRELPPIPAYHNIAMDLDPTYKGNANNLNNGLYYAQVYQVSPSSSPSDSPTSSLRSPNSTSLPYLPVQGQKRNSSERNKSKKNKDGCKTH